MNNTSRAKLPTDLHAAYEWIAAAGEWSAALAAPESYAQAARANAVDCHAVDGMPADLDQITEYNLTEVIEWYRKHESEVQS